MESKLTRQDPNTVGGKVAAKWSGLLGSVRGQSSGAGGGARGPEKIQTGRGEDFGGHLNNGFPPPTIILKIPATLSNVSQAKASDQEVLKQTFVDQSDSLHREKK